MRSAPPAALPTPLFPTLRDRLTGSAGPGATPPAAKASSSAAKPAPSRAEPSRLSAATGGTREVGDDIGTDRYWDRWVTVFGFAAAEKEVVLAELQKCGNILSCGSFSKKPANWVHILFQSRFDAQRALGMNSKQVNSQLIIGVKTLAKEHRNAIEESQGGKAAGGTSRARTIKPIARPSTLGLPKPTTGFMSKVNEYIFGL